MTDKTVKIELTEAQARTALLRIHASSDERAQEVRAAIRAALEALTPPMTEPTYPGAVVMTDEGWAVWAALPNDRVSWMLDRGLGCDDWGWYSWSNLSNPRPLTPAERRQHGIPQELPEGHVAVPIQDQGYTLEDWRDCANEADQKICPGYESVVGTLVRAYADALGEHEAGQDG